MSSINISMIGDSSVGKTTICNSLLNSTISEEHTPTVGASLMKIPFKNGDKTTWFMVWDTAGMEKYKSLAPVYYRGSKAAIIVFDVTNRESFNHLIDWINLYKENVDNNNPILIIGNKTDLINNRIIDFQTAQNFANEYKSIYIEVSAFKKINLNKILIELSKILEDFINEPFNPKNNKFKKKNDSTLCC